MSTICFSGSGITTQVALPPFIPQGYLSMSPVPTRPPMQRGRFQLVRPAMNLSTYVRPAEARSSLEEFTDRHDLSGLIELGSNLASGCFELDEPVVARMTTDQDTGEEWIELSVSAKGDVSRVRQAHRTYTREWLKAVPLEKGLMVRLAISIV
jgi:hypothetical protein